MKKSSKRIYFWMDVSYSIILLIAVIFIFSNQFIIAGILSMVASVIYPLKLVITTFFNPQKRAIRKLLAEVNKKNTQM